MSYSNNKINWTELHDATEPLWQNDSSVVPGGIDWWRQTDRGFNKENIALIHGNVLGKKNTTKCLLKNRNVKEIFMMQKSW